MVTSEDPLSLKTQDAGELLLAANQYFHIGPDPQHLGEYKAFTDAYIYRLAVPSDPSGAILEWHWHPEVRPDPHVHVPSLPKVHIASGRVTFESVLVCLANDFRVQAKRAGWEDVLAEVERIHKLYRSWG